MEVRAFFKRSVIDWMERKVGIPSVDLQEMLESLTKGNLERFGPLFQEWLVRLLSYYDPAGDKPERVYHAFLLGLLASLEVDYRIDSNAESGHGRFDLMLSPRKSTDSEIMGIVMELKTRSEEDTEKELEEALKQIKKNDYSTNLRKGSIAKILGISMLFQGKFVWVKSEALSDFSYASQNFNPSQPPPLVRKKEASDTDFGGKESFDFPQEFSDLLVLFQEFQEAVLPLLPSLEKELDKIDDKLNGINPTVKEKSKIPPDAWNRLGRLLKSSKIQNQPDIQKEWETLKNSYERIARWLGLFV